MSCQTLLKDEYSLLGNISSFTNTIKCDISVNGKLDGSNYYNLDQLLKKLPSIFHIDDYKKCKEEDKIFCRTSIILEPISSRNKSAFWDIIEETIRDPYYYNHNELFHAICANDFCSNDMLEENGLDLKEQIRECYNSKYEYLGLQSVVSKLNCQNTDDLYSPRIIDVVLLIVAVMYILFILLETYKDYERNYKDLKLNSSVMSEKTGKPIFSLITNWNKMWSIPDTPDFRKLKFIQGIRFYNMMLIILCHTVSSYIGGYVSNTAYFEMMYKSDIRRCLITLFVFLVQTFFLLSAFLLSYHVCQLMEKYENSKKKYFLLLFLNRCLRILPPLVVVIMLSYSVWIMRYFNGPLRYIYSDKECERCQKNWWTNLLFINNHYDATEMCYFVTWYLAADTQLYLISLIILWIIWANRHRTKTILMISVLIGILIPPFISYKYDFDMIYRITPENSKNDNYRSLEFNSIYTSTLINMASYMVGICLGCFYFVLERQKNWSKHYNFMGMLIFVSLPITITYVSSYKYSPLITVLLSGIVRPCYALGVGIGILTMSQQKNSIFKKIFEWRPVIFLGNFTYSIYVVQYGVVFFRTAVAQEPMILSDYVLATSYLRDVILSIFCGFLMHILVEMPAIQLQKLYIPQVRIGKAETKSLKNK